MYQLLIDAIYNTPVGHRISLHEVQFREWVNSDHPPYIPKMAPIVYLFPGLKQNLGGHKPKVDWARCKQLRDGWKQSTWADIDNDEKTDNKCLRWSEDYVEKYMD